MRPDMIISSGNLELFVAGVLPADEMKEVSLMVTTQPAVAEEITEIEEVLQTYGRLHAPELKRELVRDIITRIHEAPPVPEPPKQVSFVEKQKERFKKEVKPAPASGPVVRTQGNGVLMLVLLVFLALTGALAFYFYSQWQKAEDGSEISQLDLDRQAQEVERVKAQYDEVQQELSIYRSPQYKRAYLKGQTISPASEAIIYWNPTSKDAYLNVLYLPPATDSTFYHLWAVTQDGSATDAGTFELQDSKLPLTKIGQAESARAFMVTLERSKDVADFNKDSIFVLGGF